MLPEINVEKIIADCASNGNPLSAEHQQIVRGIVANQGVNRGRLRAAKPKITYGQIVVKGRTLREPNAIQGKTAYVWRLVAFQLSSNPQHQCLPILADFDLPYAEFGSEEQKNLKQELENLVDIIVNSVPKSQWAGVRRWARALGY